MRSTTRKADEKEIAEYYDGISSGYDELYFEEQKKKLRVVVKKLEVFINKNHKLLDVGCGTCFSHYFFDCEYFGVDPSPQMIKRFEKYDSFKNNLFVGGAEGLTDFFENNSFDYVICVSVAHHFNDWVVALENITKVSKPGAMIVFSLLRTKDVAVHEQKIAEVFEIQKKIDDSSIKDVVLVCKNKKFK